VLHSLSDHTLKSFSSFISVTALLHHVTFIVFIFFLKAKYKKDKDDLPYTLYSLLPATLETQFVKEMAETHSEVRTLNIDRLVVYEFSGVP